MLYSGFYDSYNGVESDFEYHYYKTRIAIFIFPQFGDK